MDEKELLKMSEAREKVAALGGLFYAFLTVVFAMWGGWLPASVTGCLAVLRAWDMWGYGALSDKLRSKKDERTGP